VRMALFLNIMTPWESAEPPGGGGGVGRAERPDVPALDTELSPADPFARYASSHHDTPRANHKAAYAPPGLARHLVTLKPQKTSATALEKTLGDARTVNLQLAARLSGLQYPVLRP
jgi:hypothetical protein